MAVPDSRSAPRADWPRRHRRFAAALVIAALLLLVRCVSLPGDVASGIEVCGERFPVATTVVLWRDAPNYDAYQTRKRFTEEPTPDGKRRYAARLRPGANAIDPDAAAGALSLAELQQVVHLFVLHYDTTGTSRQCFKVLQDVRNLSVHFLLDVDGTLYQTLDLREKAHHATIANDGSIGVEIAHPGAWHQPMNADMARWYDKDERGWFMKTPPWMQETGIRTPDFVARPARPAIVQGIVQGETWHQLDFTDAQYEALARLCASLSRVFPRLRLQVPREADGSVVNHVLPAERLHAFEGIVGHFHVQKNKQDPGPAFDWERLLRTAAAAR